MDYCWFFIHNAWTTESQDRKFLKKLNFLTLTLQKLPNLPQIFIWININRCIYYFNFGKGVLGDCWLLSTCAALAKREDLIYRVVDPHQVNTREKLPPLVLLYLRGRISSTGWWTLIR
jgi:hypothetical protein